MDDLGAKFEKNLYEATTIKDSLPVSKRGAEKRRHTRFIPARKLRNPQVFVTDLIIGSSQGTVVTTVQAEDRDGLNATVEYSIYKGMGLYLEI